MSDSIARPAAHRMAAFPAVLPVVFAAATALFIPASEIVAQASPDEQEPLRLVGQVVDTTTGMPAAGARVSVAASEWVSLTNLEGRFILPDLEPGPHLLSVEQLGHHTHVTRSRPGEGQRRSGSASNPTRSFSRASR